MNKYGRKLETKWKLGLHQNLSHEETAYVSCCKYATRLSVCFLLKPNSCSTYMDNLYDLIKHMIKPPNKIKQLDNKEDNDDWIGDIIRSKSFVKRDNNRPDSVPS